MFVDREGNNAGQLADRFFANYVFHRAERSDYALA